MKYIKKEKTQEKLEYCWVVLVIAARAFELKLLWRNKYINAAINICLAADAPTISQLTIGLFIKWFYYPAHQWVERWESQTQGWLVSQVSRILTPHQQGASEVNHTP